MVLAAQQDQSTRRECYRYRLSGLADENLWTISRMQEINQPVLGSLCSGTEQVQNPFLLCIYAVSSGLAAARAY